jgi:hypothetical protein
LRETNREKGERDRGRTQEGKKTGILEIAARRSFVVDRIEFIAAVGIYFHQAKISRLLPSHANHLFTISA